MNPTLIIAAVLALVSFAAGWTVQGWRQAAALVRLETAHATARATALQQHAAQLAAWQARGAALVATVARHENALTLAHQEKTDALRRLTTGRPCLGGAAVRLLNDPAGLKPAALPAPSGQPAEPDAAFASDTDVGLWAASARRQYDTCRGRLQAVADFYAAQEAAAGEVAGDE
jgi:hypothetical protein